MTTDRHLALMALMKDIEEPSATYRRSVRLAAALASTSPQWDAAVEKGNAALDEIERAVRDWTAKHPESAAAAEQPAACGKCKTPFDPADTRHDGHARSGITSFCRRCVDACHENSDAFHVCAVCREGGE